jgi:hypothetical protein
MTAVVAVAGAGVEERIAAEERRPVAMRPQADVAEGVARRIEPSSSTLLPTLTTSPALKPRSIPGILSLAAWCASSFAPVAAISAALPPM